MWPFKFFLPAILILTAVSCWLCPPGVSQAFGQSKYIPVTKYDPKRDAVQDIQEAIKGAQRAHKRILLDVGGEWCSWCHTLDRFFEAHAELIQLRDKNFVTAKINFSEIKTKTSCSGSGTFLAILTYSCLIRTASYCFQRIPAQWKSRKSYDLQRLTAFLKEWAPAGMQ